MHPNHKLILIPAEDSVERMQAYGQTKLIQQTLQRHLRPDTQPARGRRPGQMTGRADKVHPESRERPRLTRFPTTLSKSLCCVIFQNGWPEKLFHFEAVITVRRSDRSVALGTNCAPFIRPPKLQPCAHLPRVMKGKEHSESSASSGL